MNAYELADLLLTGAYPVGTREEIANMLRQQADRIKELEAWQKHDLELAEAVGFERAHKLQADRIAELEKDLHMVQRHNDQLDHDLPNAEPVAWIRADGTVDFAPNKLFTAGQPFYTTPQTKPLSDEEIKECKLKSWQQCKDTTEIIDFELSYQDELFARAIEERHGIK